MARPTVKDLTGKNSLSYSSLDTFLSCGEKYRLTRVMRVPQDQAWWFYGGTAVHTATEMIDRGDDRPLRSIWDDAWAKAIEDYDPAKPTRAGGRVTKQNPHKEDAAWWGLQGPVMVETYVQWMRTSGYQILDVAGEPAIEIEFNLELPNPDKSEDASPSIIIQGFIDRVMVTPHGQVKIVDIKTGSREPASATQLGIYHAGLRQRGIHADLGAYYMARKGDLGIERSLAHYTDDLISHWFGGFESSVRNETFIPHVTSMCTSCMVASHCYAVGGTPPFGLPFNKSNLPQETA